MKSFHRVRSSRKKKNAPTPQRTVKTPTGLEIYDSSMTSCPNVGAVREPPLLLLEIPSNENEKTQMLHVVIVNSPPFKEISSTRMSLMFFSLSSLSTSTKIFGYSSLVYAGILGWSICLSRLMALFR